MLKKKLVDKIHEIQNKDLKKMEGLEVTDRLFAFSSWKIIGPI